MSENDRRMSENDRFLTNDEIRQINEKTIWKTKENRKIAKEKRDDSGI